MEIRVKAAGEAPSVGLVDHVWQRLLLELEHCRDDVAHVEVRLGDACSPAGARDAYCLIQVRLSGGKSPTVVDIAGDPYLAAERAVRRAGRVADEQLSVIEQVGGSPLRKDDNRAPANPEGASK